jgi:hypothetical protein
MFSQTLFGPLIAYVNFLRKPPEYYTQNFKNFESSERKLTQILTPS